MPMRAAGIDVDAKDARALALQVEREVAPALLQQLVREAMRDERVEALEVEQRLDVAAAGRIAIVDGGEIGPERAAELRLVVQHLREGLADQAGIDVGMVQPLRQAMADGILQPLLAEDGRIEEAAERGLVARRLLGLAADFLPDRVDGGDVGPLASCAMCAPCLLSWRGAGRKRRACISDAPLPSR